MPPNSGTLAKNATTIRMQGGEDGELIQVYLKLFKSDIKKQAEF